MTGLTLPASKKRPNGLAQILRNPRLGQIALRAQCAAGHRQPSRHQRGKIDLYLRPAQKGDLHQPTIIGQGFEVARNIFAPDHIQNEIGATFVAHHLNEIL